MSTKTGALYDPTSIEEKLAVVLVNFGDALLPSLRKY